MLTTTKTKPLKKIVLIDDDEIFLFILRKMIVKTELLENIVTFSDAQLAFDYFKTHENNPAILPDIVILDLSMPVIDGWGFLDLYQKLEKNKETKIHICSSMVNEEDFEKLKSYPQISSILTKPISRTQLLNIITQ